MDSFYLIVYEAMDPIYNLPLPSSGAHIYVGKEGKIRSAKFFIEEYAIEYPEIAITAEKAKEIVSSETLVQLSIQLDEDHDNIRDGMRLHLMISNICLRLSKILITVTI